MTEHNARPDGWYLCKNRNNELFWLANKDESGWWDGVMHLATCPLGIIAGPLDLPNLARDLALLAKLPNTDTLRRCEEIIQSSIDSHVSWAGYRRRQGPDNPEYGDLEHHETCLKEYAEVVVVLVTIRAALAVRAAQTKGERT